MEVLILGGEGCGKSMLVRRMKEVAAGTFEPDYLCETTMPTVGVELNTIKYEGKSYALREIGSAISSRWDTYLPECAFLIFLIDVSDMGSVASSMVLLNEVLSNSQSPAGKPILIALNKVDLTHTHSLAVVYNVLGLHALQTQENISIEAGSCLDDTQCNAALKWLDKQR